ncbi:uncharacterized protein PV07_08596 [Cladophialophora immunda]|uniref:Protein kinase domain-containing protein n=1 Tax=Cladophialophora immunda TaxID=569365 RepID=A0A0D2C2E7_9EURO|nr:uncharacterized protein PV07_08596 [Cladophialophora immunda]KIW25423.1 hypothetical protein PV07_08596 [Cladophialophora immunda]
MALATDEMSNGSGSGSGSDPFVRRIQEIRIGDKYQLAQKLGVGGFGGVYLGRGVDTGKESAIIIEHSMRGAIEFNHGIKDIAQYLQLLFDQGDLDPSICTVLIVHIRMKPPPHFTAILLRRIELNIYSRKSS